jgi:propanol-preferring alcohol dehydrogenase
MNGFAIDGFFAEYAVVEYKQAMVIPQGLDPVAAAPLFCAGVTAHHAINDLKLPAGSWVAVIGCGGLGLLAVQYAKAMGYRVIGIDMSTAALDEAKASGAEHVFNPAAPRSESDGQTYVAEILKITGQGVDAAVNFTASKRAYDAMPDIIRPGRGIFMAVGIPKEPLEINAYDIALGRYRVMGSNNGTCYNMPDAINFSAKHNVLSKIEYYPLEDLPIMVKKMQDHKATGRMAVKF